jgi:hypothetical protein
VLASYHKVSRPHDSVQARAFNPLNIDYFTCRWTATGRAQMQHSGKIYRRSIGRIGKLSILDGQVFASLNIAGSRRWRCKSL